MPKGNKKPSRRAGNEAVETVGPPVGIEDEYPGPLGATWFFILDTFYMFFDFFRANTFLVLLLAVVGVAAAVRYSPHVPSRQIFLMAGFVLVLVFLAAFVIANYRIMQQKRVRYLEEQKRYEEWSGEDERQ